MMFDVEPHPVLLQASFYGQHFLQYTLSLGTLSKEGPAPSKAEYCVVLFQKLLQYLGNQLQ